MTRWRWLPVLALLLASGCVSTPAEPPGPTDEPARTDPETRWENQTVPMRLTVPAYLGGVEYGRHECLEAAPGHNVTRPVLPSIARFALEWQAQSPLTERLYLRAFVFRDPETRGNVTYLPPPERLGGVTGAAPLLLEIPAFGLGRSDRLVVVATPPEDSLRLAAYNQETRLGYALPYGPEGGPPKAEVVPCPWGVVGA